MLFLFRHPFHICFLPSPMCPGTVLAAPRFGSLPGSFPVIPLKIYDSHKTPETARAQAPGGAAVLESLFEGADRLTLKVRCDPQMCHLVQKKLFFFSPWQCLFRRNASERNLGVIFELFVLCLPFDRASLSCVNCKADRGPDGIEQLHQQRRDNERKEKSCVHSMTSSLYISLFFLSVSFFYSVNIIFMQIMCAGSIMTSTLKRRWCSDGFHPSPLAPGARSPLQLCLTSLNRYKLIKAVNQNLIVITAGSGRTSVSTRRHGRRDPSTQSGTTHRPLLQPHMVRP